MITDIPQLCPYHTMNLTITGCNGVTLPRTITVTDRIRTVELTPQLTPQELRIEEVVGLKAQLMEDLQAVEAHEAVMRNTEVPKTIEEMNEVEENLKNSLAEVQKLKKELAAQK